MISFMTLAVPLYKKADVDRAGEILIDKSNNDADFDRALEIINNWRSSHSFPLNTFQTTLRRKGKSVDKECLIAQRIKRLVSIRAKLERQTVRLTQMQDIGGCRAIVSSVAQVRKLVKLYETSDLKHKLDHTDNYIDKPRATGYRGIHLIYRYHSDRKDTYEGLKVEMQFRSPMQHAWATAVETVGAFIQHALKSSQGPDNWLRFFALMGTVIALAENTPTVPGTPSDQKILVDELRAYARSLDVERILRVYSTALQILDEEIASNAHYFLLKLDPLAQEVTVKGFKARELAQASEEYLAMEKSIAGSNAEVVLVSVESLSVLRRAYPNYFADTDAFLGILNWAIMSKHGRKAKEKLEQLKLL